MPAPLPTDASLEQPFPRTERRSEAVVQERPTLGSLPRAKRGLGWWLQPLIDLLCSAAALSVVIAIEGAALLPALLVAPVALVAANLILSSYGAGVQRDSLGASGGAAWPVLRALVAVLFVWIASLLVTLGSVAQLGLWLGFLTLDFAVRALVGPLSRRLEGIERWVLVGDETTAERLRAFRPLRQFATVVHVIPVGADAALRTDRIAALEVVDRHRADRVVIGSQHADDEGLLHLVREFRSLGVPVSLLPRPLDLLEAPGATPSRVGGVPLIEVDALAARRATPYTGPDRRRDRRSKVSVVVPAINEERNIGKVLERLPDNLHEVILVDGKSRDRTIEVARETYPEIRVLTQSGSGKGDALRTGFAAVSGNLIVMLDADGSADPAEIPRFVAALEAGADFAKGSRFLEGGGSDDITRLRSLGNSFLSGSANLLHGTHFTDLCYGYNAFWTRCLPFISLDAPGFEVETLINLRIASAGMKITEVPSYEMSRMHGQSNLNTFRDGFRVLGTILSEARRRRGLRTDRRAAKGRAAEAKTVAA